MATLYNDQRTTDAKNAYCNAYIAGATIKKAYGTVTVPASAAAETEAVLADKLSSDVIIHTIKITNTAAGTGKLNDNDIVIRKSDNLTKPKTNDVLLADGVDFATAAENKEVLAKGLTSFDKTKSLNQVLEMGADALGGYLALVLVANAANGESAVTLDYEIEYSSPQ